MTRAVELPDDDAAILAVAFGTHFATGANETAEWGSHSVLRALQLAHWRDAEYMASSLLGALKNGNNDPELRVNLWMARQELPDWDQSTLREQIKSWQPPENQHRYTLAKSALLYDAASAITSLQDGIAVGNLTATELKDWPLISRLRHQSKEFDRAFGLVLVTH